jgi:hypothetical protein
VSTTTDNLRFRSVRYDPHTDGPGLLTLYTPGGQARLVRLSPQELATVAAHAAEVLRVYFDERGVKP